MQDKAKSILFYPLTQGVEDVLDRTGLFLNAFYDVNLSQFSNLTLQQHFKPSADALAGAGFFSAPEIPQGRFSYVMHDFPKDMQEARYQIARGLQVLETGGVFICAAQNNAGGNRISAIFKDFGLEDIQELSKSKARCVWGVKRKDVDLTDFLKDGEIQPVLGGAYYARPGLFGWDKIDVGSALLARVLPPDLKGSGADFGCGYGYLAVETIQKCKEVVHLLCADADARALPVCQKNLQIYDTKSDVIWADLTDSFMPRALDFIVMNPPFHQGSREDSDIGAAFIKTAAQSLREGGELWMVANRHLPYEVILKKYFAGVENVVTEGGFKVFRAKKSL